MKARDRYDSLFRYYAETRGMPWRVLKSLAMAESSLNPDAVSRVGAQGLGQFMKATAIWMGVKDPFDPEESIQGMAAYLSQLFWNANAMVQGEDDLTEEFLWRVAAASYNCGWGYAREALHQMQRDNKPMTWTIFSLYLPNVRYKGRSPKAQESLAHAEKVVPAMRSPDFFSLA